MRYDVVALALAFLVVLWFMHHRYRAAIKAQRAGVFTTCLSLFESCRVMQDDVDFPVLTGRYRGYSVRLQPIVDHITVRKLPSLWLLVTVQGDVPYRGVFDLLVRPQNTEFYSPSITLPAAIDVPAGWPEHASLRTDAPEEMPPFERIDGHISMFDDPKTKELLITPRGVRIVYQANQATRAHYLVLRQAEFRDATLSAELVQRLLDQAIAVQKTLAEGARQNAEHESHGWRPEPAIAV